METIRRCCFCFSAAVYKYHDLLYELLTRSAIRLKTRHFPSKRSLSVFCRAISLHLVNQFNWPSPTDHIISKSGKQNAKVVTGDDTGLALGHWHTIQLRCRPAYDTHPARSSFSLHWLPVAHHHASPGTWTAHQRPSAAINNSLPYTRCWVLASCPPSQHCIFACSHYYGQPSTGSLNSIHIIPICFLIYSRAHSPRPTQTTLCYEQ